MINVMTGDLEPSAEEKPKSIEDLTLRTLEQLAKTNRKDRGKIQRAISALQSGNSTPAISLFGQEAIFYSDAASLSETFSASTIGSARYGSSPFESRVLFFSGLEGILQTLERRKKAQLEEGTKGEIRSEMVKQKMFQVITSGVNTQAEYSDSALLDKLYALYEEIFP